MKNTFKVLGIITLLVTIAFLAASCDIEIPVSGVTLKETASLPVGSSETLIATIEPSDATNQKLTWSSSDSAKVSVTQRGVITGVAAGNAYITVTTDDGNKTASCYVTVSDPGTVSVTGVTLNKSSTILAVGGSPETLIATVAPSNATNQNVTWSSSDSAKVSVTANGVVSGLAEGSATITVTTADGSKTATCSVTVSGSAVAVTGVSLDETSISITAHDFKTLTPTITPSTATTRGVTWSSSNDNVATVTSSGNVIGISAGTATITVRTDDGGKTATCTVIVTVPANIPVTSVTLNKKSTILAVNDATEKLSATVLPDNATNKNVTWSSSETAVAMVEDGIIIGVKAGNAVITATSVADGSKTATCTVTVLAAKVPVTSVTLKLSTSILISGTETLAAVIVPANATNQSVTWTSSNNAVATVTESGEVKGLTAGSATITVRTEDASKTATCTVTVSATAVEVTNVSLNKTTTSIVAGNTETLSCAITPSYATNQNLEWSSSNAAIATVSANGEVKGIAAGSAIITVKTADGNKTATCNVTVSAAIAVTSVTLENSSTPLPLTVGGSPGTLTATVLPATATNKNVTWSSSNTNIATVSGNGLSCTVTAVSAGSAIITVTTADGNKTATRTVTVTAAQTQTISVTINETNPQVGDRLTTDVQKNFQGPITYKWYRGSDTNPIYWENSYEYNTRFEDLGKTITVEVTCEGKIAKSPSVYVDDAAYTVNIYNWGGNYLYPQLSYGNNWSSIPDNFACQWFNNNVAINGATSNNYYLKEEDFGKPIKIKVTSSTGKSFESENIVVMYYPVTGVSLNETTANISVGYSKELYAEISPDNATNRNVTWSSSDPSVATVSENGIVIAVSDGSTTITVKTEDSDITATCAVTVTTYTGGNVNISATTLTITNAPVAKKDWYTDNGKEVDLYIQFDETVNGLSYIDDKTLSNVFDGSNTVTLIDGKLSISLGTPKPTELMSLSETNNGLTISDKTASIFMLSTISDKNHNNNIESGDEVGYIYSDKDVTISGTTVEQYYWDDIEYTNVYDWKLKTGWNAVIMTETKTGNSVVIKTETGNPTGNEKWLYNNYYK